MYILKNAGLAIRRNKGRNILIGIIILVIACASAVTIAIKNSASNLIKSYTESYDVEASIGIDRESLMGNFDPTSDSMEDKRDTFNQIENVTIDQINEFGNSDYVSSYYYTYSVGLNSDSIAAATSTTSGDSNQPSFGGHGMDQQMSSTDFTVTGYSSLEAMTNFINGTYTITDGEVSNDFESNNCVINSELASLNSISVGDTITLYDPDNTENTYDLVVTGIFSDNEDSTDNKMSMFSGSANTIITNTSVITNIVSNSSEIKTTLTPTFLLTSSSVVDSFTSEVREKGLSEYLSVTTNLDEVEEATSSISNVSTFATTFLIVTLVIGGVVLFVINMINVRERKYEIGVLRTIGMKKSLLTLQFSLEILIVSLFAIILGTGIGASISVPVANQLLKNEINSSSENMNNISNNFGGNVGDSSSRPSDKGGFKFNGVANVEKVSSINAVVDFKVMLEIIGIGVILTIISSSASMISIQRFSPLTILKERS